MSSLCSIDKNFIVKMLEIGTVYWLMWLAFLLIVNLTIMRMLTGIILGVVSDVNHKYKDDRKRSQLEKQLGEQLAKIDKNGNGCISREDFKLLYHNPEITESLVLLGVDLGFLAEEVLNELNNIEKELPVADLVERMLTCRGANMATLSDIVRLHRSDEKILDNQRRLIQLLQQQISKSSCA